MMDNDKEFKEVLEGSVKRLTEMKTMKKARQKARRTSPKEEEPKMRSSEVSKQVPWEQDSAQGKACFLSKDYPRLAWLVVLEEPHWSLTNRASTYFSKAVEVAPAGVTRDSLHFLLARFHPHQSFNSDQKLIGFSPKTTYFQHSRIYHV